MEPSQDQSTIKLGEYIVLQKGNFMKIHQLSKNSCVMLGRDKIDLTSIIGHKFWTNFKMVHKKGSKREFELIVCDKSESLLNLIDKDVRGTDNRDIWDDGSSQLMSADEIFKLRDRGCSGQDIVGQLLENSKTFHCKTEYSQQKYLKKKEKKYFEYVVVLRPNIRVIAQILFSKDPQKVLNLRSDTLSQIVTAVNLQPTGKYLLYENGCQGLVTAVVLNHLGGNGRLIHLYPNLHYQKHAVLAMNFQQKDLDSFISVRLSSFLKKMFPDSSCKVSGPSVGNCKLIACENSNDPQLESSGGLSSSEVINGGNTHECCERDEDISPRRGCLNTDDTEVSTEEIDPAHEPPTRQFIETSQSSQEQKLEDSALISDGCKRKSSTDDNDAPSKKSKWELEVDKAVDILSTVKADGLIIICKEYPIHLINRLIKLVAFSRNMVVYSMYQEPIVKLFCELKLRKDVIGVKLTESFLRNYQVLPDRTHPEINMSSSGGFLLTATVVSPEDCPS
ncbi:unnamed protein product [Bemisia tabaci]|uniref:tRNA (adenine(58)-N(1))-methyltransferase non-catalytic subunit TRM6 n=1 Tax=Bemisia tabaci TaxID=7038 RepID=A0A9P0EY90_BEMTA|nr:unnamed protein product [Bemisia tabaci]